MDNEMENYAGSKQINHTRLYEISIVWLTEKI